MGQILMFDEGKLQVGEGHVYDETVIDVIHKTTT